MVKKTIFVMLLIWITPLCVKGTETAEINASNPKHEQQTILKGKVEAESINNDPNKHKEGMAVIEGISMTKIQQLQYTQLLEVHRSYFTIFLQIVSIYLVVIGGCISIVDLNIRSMKGNEGKDGSKTILFVLIFFALVLSGLFWLGLGSGREDAEERRGQIAIVAKQLNNITPVNVNLLENIIGVMCYGVQAIIILWIFVIVRGLMFVEGIKKCSTLIQLMWWGAGSIATLWLVWLIYRLSCE